MKRLKEIYIEIKEKYTKIIEKVGYKRMNELVLMIILLTMIMGIAIIMIIGKLGIVEKNVIGTGIIYVICTGIIGMLGSIYTLILLPKYLYTTGKNSKKEATMITVILLLGIKIIKIVIVVSIAQKYGGVLGLILFP